MIKSAHSRKSPAEILSKVVPLDLFILKNKRNKFLEVVGFNSKFTHLDTILKVIYVVQMGAVIGITLNLTGEFWTNTCKMVIESLRNLPRNTGGNTVLFYFLFL